MNNGVRSSLMAIRLIVFDLDGTLLGADNRLSGYTAAVLERARAAGLTLVAASGRSHWAANMEQVLSTTDAVEYVICSNGAQLYHRPTRRVVRRRTLTATRLRNLYQSVGEVLGADQVCWAWETKSGVVPDAEFRALGTTPGAELDELVASPALDLPREPGLSIEQRLAEFGPTVRALLAPLGFDCEEAVRRLHQRVPARLSSSSAVFLEVTAPGVHKGAMLKDLCAREGIDQHEVMAFGDHLNDLTMLRWAGRGIAMRNAHTAVAKQVPEKTEHSNADDGVALAIEKLLADL